MGLHSSPLPLVALRKWLLLKQSSLGSIIDPGVKRYLTPLTVLLFFGPHPLNIHLGPDNGAALYCAWASSI